MRTATLAALGIAAASPAPAAQTELYALDGAAPGDRFGSAVCAAGDVDGDGFGDLAVGAPYHDSGAPDGGRVVVISGRTRQTIRSWIGSVANGRFGAALAACGDLDGDGAADLAVGAPGLFGGPNGHVQVVSGATGAVLRSWAGAPGFGSAVAAGADASGDGVADLLVGSPLASEAWLLDGATGATLRQHVYGGLAFGTAVAFVGDVTADGRSEYAATNPDTWGEVLVFRADTGALLWSRAGGFGDELGHALAAVEDLTGDGSPDLLAGARDEGSLGSDGRGYVMVLDGASGAIVDTVHGANPNDHLGSALVSAGDADGDGLGDFFAGQVLAGLGHEVQLRRGSDRAVIAAVPPAAPGVAWGRSLAFGDVTGDGLADLAIGAPLRDAAGTDSGSVFVYSIVRAPVVYCASETNSLGCTPAISSAGTPSSSLPSPFDVGATSVLNHRNGLLFYGYKPRQTPFQGGSMCVVAPLVRTPIQSSGGNAPPANDCSGVFSLDFNARIQSGVDPQLVAGEEVFAQYWSRDPADPSGTNLSDALAFHVQP
jgi:hypothetical protein